MSKKLQIFCRFFSAGEPDISIFHPKDPDGSSLVQVLGRRKPFQKGKILGEISLVFDNDKKGRSAIVECIRKIRSIVSPSTSPTAPCTRRLS